jgi:hypothetical protein
MSIVAPKSFARVYAALKGLMPPGVYSDDDMSRALKELGVIAWIMARVVDRCEAVLDNFFMTPGFTEFLDRFERFFKLPVRPLDDPAVRIARILNIWRRRIGYQKGPLARSLAPILDCDPSDLVFLEPMRAPIDAMTTFSQSFGAGVTIPSPNGTLIRCDTDWPDLVDDTGALITVEFNATDATDVTLALFHASGANVVFWPNQAGSGNVTVSYEERVVFKGLPAKGPWALFCASTNAHGIAKVLSWSLRVSNDADSRAIYEGFIYRDPALGGNPDLGNAQMNLDQIGIAHVRAVICESTSFTTDDPANLTDRDPED